MAEWNHNWKVNEIIEDYNTTSFSDEDAKQLAARITSYLKARPLVDDEHRTDMIIDNFEFASDGEALEFALEELFDWADSNLIWLGTP